MFPDLEAVALKIYERDRYSTIDPDQVIQDGPWVHLFGGGYYLWSYCYDSRTTLLRKITLKGNWWYRKFFVLMSAYSAH